MSLIDLLPDYYKKSEQVVDLQNAIGLMVDNIENIRNDLFAQLFVKDATWGLELWEKELGIQTDLSKSYGFRRERVQAKLRGSGTTTVDMIKQVASSYSNGTVEVIEDPGNYSFKVKFVGTKGIPDNMVDLTLTIEEIKPAHLAFEFEYVYNTWADIAGLTWSQANAYTWEGLRIR